MDFKLIAIWLVVNALGLTSSLEECFQEDDLPDNVSEIREQILSSLPSLLQKGFQKASEDLKAEASKIGKRRNVVKKEVSGIGRRQSDFRPTTISAKITSACRGLGFLEASKIAVEEFGLTKEQIKVLKSIDVDPSSLPELPDARLCQAEKIRVSPLQSNAIEGCDSEEPYRKIDGSCNNLVTGKGRAETPFKRLLEPDYDDGISTIREAGLPNPRNLSLALTASVMTDTFDLTVSQLLNTWGQFIDHDITLTPRSKASEPAPDGSLEDIECCKDGSVEDTTEMDPNCSPIDVSWDPFHKSHGFSCLPFIRSLEADTGGLGPREQMNQITSFIDASSVYGSSEGTAIFLREFKNGRLKDTTPGEIFACSGPSKCLNFLPLSSSKKTFVAGDSRSQAQPSLTSLHTIFVRYHNLLSNKLASIPAFEKNDELLYQETRRIISAVIEHITISEYLPIILGPSTMESFALNPGPKEYNASIDPSIINAFATAAFRYGHSHISKQINGDITIELVEAASDVKSLITVPLFFPSKLLQGDFTRHSSKHDVFLVDDLTNKLFAAAPDFAHGLDLLAMNIKRGRDHGLPGYNSWREKCCLPTFPDFESMSSEVSQEVIDVFKAHYDHPDDIDLYPGGLAEKAIEDGKLGPTFTCILARQFKDIIYGDRFWFENNEQPKPFTPDQLKTIKETSLATILCETTTIKYMPSEPMKHPTMPGNHLRPCSAFKKSVLRFLKKFWKPTN